MKKKITIVGKGTVGCMSLLHYLSFTDFDVDWAFDPNIPTSSVGEGTQIKFPKLLFDSLNFNHYDLTQVGGTIKQGIYKENWGTKNDNFYHPFAISSFGIHMSAVDLQKKIYEMVDTDKCRAKIVEMNMVDPNEIDSDYVMVCSGTPKDFETDYEIRKHIPVNTAFVNQCFWDYPRFTHTLTIARPYGWVFGIPLQKRCSIGYLFNRDINNLDEIKDDIKNIFEQYNLTPSDTTNYIEFKNYSRKENFTEKVVYNGNASFFLEPLEATSTAFADGVNRLSWDLWHGNLSTTVTNELYQKELNDIESMICLHYLPESKFKTKFWEYANNLADERLRRCFSINDGFSSIVRDSINSNTSVHDYIGTWTIDSFKINLKGLGLEEKINSMFKKCGV